MNDGTDKKDETREILYLGNDSSYWTTIKNRVSQKLNEKAVNYHSIKLNNTTNYQIVYLEVIKINPHIIFFDFSTNVQFFLKLAHMLKRENSLKNTPIIGLVEKKENAVDCIFAGVEVIHVKCGEYHDIIYDAFFLAFPTETETPDFAKAEFERDVTLICDLRLGYITPTSFHAEGNVKLDPDTTITIESEVPMKMVPSQKFICKDISNFDLYYDYKYNYELQFLFVDEPEFDDEELEQRLEGLDENQRVLIIKTTKVNRRLEVADYKSRLKKTKKDVTTWISDNMDRVKPKKTKILIIDKDLKFLLDPKKILGDLPFTVRTQTYLNEELNDIKVLRPDIISFQFFDLDRITQEVEDHFENGLKEDGTPYYPDELSFVKEELLKDKINDGETQVLDQLSLILKTIKSLDNYKPFIILFNCHSYSSQSIQESFKYPFIIVNKNKIDLNPVIDMATMLEKRNDKKKLDLITSKVKTLKKSDPKKYRSLSNKDFEDKKYYLSNKNTLSKISTTFPVVLKSMTESELSFSSKLEFDPGTYRLDFPVDMSITIVPIDGNNYEVDGDKKIYHCLIHSVGEDDKKKLRQFVNEIFFSDLNKKRSEEDKSFKELNESERMRRIQEMEEIETKESEQQAAEEHPEDVPLPEKS
jgi:hypothetical protein